MVCFRRRGLRWLLLRESSLDATLVDRYRLGWRGWRVPTHDLPLAGGLDASGLEEVEDTPAVVRLSDAFVTNWAGHFGMNGFSLERMVPF